MNCPKCEKTLYIGRTFKTTKDDETFTNMPMCCTNPDCTKYTGKDLSSPLVVAHMAQHKVEG